MKTTIANIYWALSFDLNSLILILSEVGTLVNPSLQMRKLRFTEIKWPANGGANAKEEMRFDSSNLVQEPLFSITRESILDRFITI